jgi:excisionase family DNA binding protein
MKHQETPDLLTPEEIARIMKCTPKHVRDICHSGLMKYHRVGVRPIRVDRKDFLQYLESCKSK